MEPSNEVVEGVEAADRDLGVAVEAEVLLLLLPTLLEKVKQLGQRLGLAVEEELSPESHVCVRQTDFSSSRRRQHVRRVRYLL